MGMWTQGASRESSMALVGGEAVLGPSQLVAHWGGYAAIFFVVLLGNLGLPVPEPSASSSPVVGDSIGYRIGRRYGGAVVAMKRFKSLQDRILVRRLEKKEVTKGDIIISDAA